MKHLIKLFFFMTFLTTYAWAQNNFELLLGNTNKDKYAHVTISRVLSADKILITNSDGAEERIKLIGLKAPEPPRSLPVERDANGIVIEPTVSPETSVEEQSFDYAKKLLEGKTARLEFDTEIRNEDGTKQAYVFLTENNLFANAEILRQGFAFLHLNPLNLKYADQLRDAYKEAKKELRGLQND
ncbi:MAG: thermonuclease family protein [Candidatus Omnitrophica bacterium]|nr:thermonuclease family protein [Candidatus Omnitrophota bacterium]